jgi:hypothetical protein
VWIGRRPGKLRDRIHVPGYNLRYVAARQFDFAAPPAIRRLAEA